MKNKLVLLILIGCALTTNQSNFQTNYNKVSRASTSQSEVFDYSDVLEKYYEIAIEGTECQSTTFEEFYDYYYDESSDGSLINATLKYADLNNNYSRAKNILGVTGYENSSLYTTSSPDADYILNTTSKQGVTPQSEFKRNPIYYAFDYSSVQVGDIVYEYDTPVHIGHCALVADNAHSKYDNEEYIQTIEAVGSGVKFGFLDDWRMAHYKCTILRVYKNDTVYEGDVVRFANYQIGKGYSLHPDECKTSISSDSWYCSELVYAAWKFAGVDVSMKYVNGHEQTLHGPIYPLHIYNSDNTYELVSKSNYFLNIRVINKSWSTWTIQISNNSNYNRDVYYNRKMCNYEDADTWNNLADIANINIPAYSSENVNIDENWFATCISVSFTSGIKRYVTFADHLDNNNKSLVWHYRIR